MKKQELEKNYPGYQAYYVEVLPHNRKVYNKAFTPSDNKTHEQRRERSDIKVIDGKSFYGLISGDPDFVKVLYHEYLPSALQNAIEAINGERERGEQLPLLTDYHLEPFFNEMLDKTYS